MTLILALYVLTLNVFPCGDEALVSNDSQTELITDLNSDHHHHASDLCAPFCSCHCCHVHIVHFDSIDFNSFNPEITAKEFFHFNPKRDVPVYTLLDPPIV